MKIQPTEREVKLAELSRDTLIAETLAFYRATIVFTITTLVSNTADPYLRESVRKALGVLEGKHD